MLKQCIICGNRTGSGEHLFPAALGGRRICNSIYCRTHNEGFSPLVSILSKQFEAINALLAVRPDRKKGPRITTVEGDNGEQLLLSGAGVTLTDGNPSGGVSKIPLSFGGPEGLRAVAYIALTYLARYFPAYAAQEKLTEFKTYVLGGPASAYIWWDKPEPPPGFPVNPFAFGHTIVLQVSQSMQAAFAHISLFSSLNFTVAFGPVVATSDASMIVHINPQAELPHDFSEVPASRLLFQPPSETAGSQHLVQMVRDGTAQEAVQRLFSKINEWTLTTATQPLFDELRNLCARMDIDRHQMIGAVLRQQPTLVYRLLTFCVSGLMQQFTDMPFMQLKLDRMVERDEGSPSGLTPVAFACLERGIEVIARAIDAELCTTAFDVHRLAMLVAGGPGAHIVGTAVIVPLLGV